MRKELCLVLGGARSGKSAFAVSQAHGVGERVVFAATAEAGDDEMRARIERHRRERPAHWRTLEAPVGLGEAIRAAAGTAEVVIVDCLSFLVANVIGNGGGIDAVEADARVAQEMEALLSAFEGGRASFIVVSNEVGMGVVPAYASGRVFRDALGRANQRLSRAADRVYWMLAGMGLEVKASGLAESCEGPYGST